MNTQPYDLPSLRIFVRTIAVFAALFAVHLNGIAQRGYIWSTTIQGSTSNEAGIDVDCDASGAVFVAGDYGNNANFGGVPEPSWGNRDMFTCQFDPFGNFEWVHTEGNTVTDRTFAVRAGSDGHIYSAGYGLVIFPAHRVAMHAWDAVTMRLRPDGSLHWGWAMNGGGAMDFSEALDIAPDPFGNSYTVGVMKNDGWYATDTVYGIGAEDAFVVKFDSIGDFRWGKALGGISDDQANGVDVGPDGHIWVGGSFRGTANFDAIPLTSGGNTDGFIAKIDSNGNVVFARPIQGPSFAEVIRLKVSADGDCYFAGNFAGTITLGAHTLVCNDTTDIFYGKMDAAGNFLWAKRAGGFDQSKVQDIDIDSEENIYLGGYFFGGISWQGDSATSQMWDDLYFAKTDSNGVLDFVEYSGDLGSRDVFGIAVDPAQNILLTGVFTDTISFGSTTHNSTLHTLDIFVAKYASRVQEMAIVSLTGTPFCSADQFVVTFNAWGNFDSTNVFYLELSDANGSFANPDVVGSLAGSYGGSITGTVPIGIAQGSQYRVRIRATSPALVSPDNGQDFALYPSTAVPVDISGDTVLCNGQPVTLSIDPWLSHQIWSTGDTSAAITVSVPGVVWVEATDTNGCSNRDEVLVTLCVGLAEMRSDYSIQVFPNPSEGRFQLKVEGLLPGNYQLEIFDSQGRQVFNRQQCVRGGISLIPVDLSGAAAGIYFAKLSGNDSQCGLRFELQ